MSIQRSTKITFGRDFEFEIRKDDKKKNIPMSAGLYLTKHISGYISKIELKPNSGYAS